MNIFAGLIDLIYPPRCAVCQTFLWSAALSEGLKDLPFCRACLDGFVEVRSPICPACGRPYASGAQDDRWCEDCLRRRPNYDSARAPYLYEGGLMTAIHAFKYGEKSHLANPLGTLLASFARVCFIHLEGLLVIPVPLHPKRLRERGFNQSLLLARRVALPLDADLDFLSLRRVRHTKPQTGLDSDERRKNVRRAFEVIDRKTVKGRTILLVDDVATTGSTLNECARVLKRAGAVEVHALALARTLLL